MQNRKTACHARESEYPLCKNKRKNEFPLSPMNLDRQWE